MIVDCSVLKSSREQLISTFSSFLVNMELKKNSFSGSPCEMTSAPVSTAFGAAEGKSERGEKDGGEQRGGRLGGLTSAGQTRAR